MKPKKHRTDFDHRRFASLAPLAREIPDIDSAISLLMISYTTRFLHLAHLARSLHAINPGAPEPTVLEQIENIRKRILLIRHMRATGISSLLLCVICMCLLFEGQVQIGSNLFIASLALMSVSLLLSLGEIWISVDALNVHLLGIAEEKGS